MMIDTLCVNPRVANGASTWMTSSGRWSTDPSQLACTWSNGEESTDVVVRMFNPGPTLFETLLLQHHVHT